MSKGRGVTRGLGKNENLARSWLRVAVALLQRDVGGLLPEGADS